MVHLPGHHHGSSAGDGDGTVQTASQGRREEAKIVEETARQGVAVHTFNADATPEQKAAAAGHKIGRMDMSGVQQGTEGRSVVSDMDLAAQQEVAMPPPKPIDITALSAEAATTHTVRPDTSKADALDAEVGWNAVGRYNSLSGRGLRKPTEKELAAAATEDEGLGFEGLEKKYGDEAEIDEESTWLEKNLSDGTFGEWWHNAGIIFFSAFAGWFLGLVGGGIGGLLVVVAVGMTYYRTSVRRFRRNTRDTINRTMAKARLEQGTESAEWINSFLTKFWVIYEPVLSATIVGTVDQVLSTNTPPFLDSLRLSTFTLGTKPPRIEHVRTYPKSEEDVVLMDWKFSFNPNDTDDLTMKQMRTRVNPKIILSIRVGKGLVSGAIPILVEDFAFSGLMRVRLRLITEFPHVQTVDLSFMEKPTFDYICKPIGGDHFGFDVGLIPGLTTFITEQVHANLGPMMYNPNVFTLNIEQMLSGAGVAQAIGVVQITVYAAKGLRNPDRFSGHPDPYCRLSINQHAELAKTKVIRDSSNPRFNETKYLLVTSLNDALTLEFLDFNDYRKDKSLGVASFDLKKLEEDAEMENQQLPVVYNAKERGSVNFDIAYYPVLKPTKNEDGTEEPVPETTTGIVRFTVHQCKDLDGKKSVVGQLSPYACFMLNGKQIHMSPISKRTNNPIWDESFEMLISDRPNCRLGVVIKDDRDLQSDPTVGKYQIFLNDLLKATKEQKNWFSLAGDNGRIRLSAEWKSVSMPGGIHGSGGYIVPIGMVRLHFKRGIDLRNVEAKTGGKSDPYVRVLISNDMKAKTTWIKNDLNPVWDEILYVPVRSQKEKLTLEVMDYQSHSRDRSLGWYELDCSTLIQKNDTTGEWLESAQRFEVTKPLLDHRKTAKGSIEFTAHFYPCMNIEDGEWDGTGAAQEAAEKKARQMAGDVTEDEGPVSSVVNGRSRTTTMESLPEPRRDVPAPVPGAGASATKVDSVVVVPGTALPAITVAPAVPAQTANYWGGLGTPVNETAYTVPPVTAGGTAPPWRPATATASVPATESSMPSAYPSDDTEARLEPSDPFVEPTAAQKQAAENAHNLDVTEAEAVVDAQQPDVLEANAALNDAMPEPSGPPKMKMTPEELLQHPSGLFIFNIMEGQISEKGVSLQIIVDDNAYPAYITAPTRSQHAKWDEVGDAFIRELEFSRVTMKLVRGSDADGDVIASLTGDTLETLKQCLNNPTVLPLQSVEPGVVNKVKVSCKYIPVPIVLDASESINNSGTASITVVSGKNLPAADRSGKSDPYAVFCLNEEKIFKTQTIKKTLNPTWNETFEANIQSRTAANFRVDVYDWDANSRDDFLGSGRINLSEIEPFTAKTLTIPLNGKSGEVTVRVVFRPSWVARTRRNTTSTFSGRRALTNVASAPVKGVGAAGHGLHKAGSFLKHGIFGKHKEGSQEELEDNDERDIANLALESGGGIKGNSEGGAVAVTGDNAEVPLSTTQNGNGGSLSVPQTAPGLAYGHNRSASAASSADGYGTIRVAVLEGSGFSAKEKVQVVVRTPQGKDIVKTKGLRASQPQWNEENSFAGPATQQLIIQAREHHTLGADKDIGEAVVSVADHLAGDFWVNVEGGSLNQSSDGAKVRLRLNFKQQTDTSSLKSKQSAEGGAFKGLSPFRGMQRNKSRRESGSYGRA
ncbi:Tricalbin-2 [Saitoella coloradoensis]